MEADSAETAHRATMTTPTASVSLFLDVFFGSDRSSRCHNVRSSFSSLLSLSQLLSVYILSLVILFILWDFIYFSSDITHACLEQHPTEAKVVDIRMLDIRTLLV